MKQCRTVLCLMLCAAVLLATCACGQKTDSKGNTVPSGFQAIEAENSQYILYVPEDWKIDTTKGMTSVYVEDAQNSSLSVVTNEIGSNFSLDEYWKTFAQDLFPSTFGELEMIKDGEEYTLDGADGRMYEYTANVGGQDYHWLQVISIRNTLVYIITYTSTKSGYETNMKDVTGILEYFKFE